MKLYLNLLPYTIHSPINLHERKGEIGKEVKDSFVAYHGTGSSVSCNIGSVACRVTDWFMTAL